MGIVSREHNVLNQRTPSSHPPQGALVKGEGGVPWVQIMENELECLGDRKGRDGH